MLTNILVIWLAPCARCHFLTRFSVISAMISWGKLVNGPPIKKWPGVIAFKSFGLDDSDVRGLEFKQASICANNVKNFSKLKVRSINTAFKCFSYRFNSGLLTTIEVRCMGGYKMPTNAFWGRKFRQIFLSCKNL